MCVERSGFFHQIHYLKIKELFGILLSMPVCHYTSRSWLIMSIFGTFKYARKRFLVNCEKNEIVSNFLRIFLCRVFILLIC